MNVLFCTAECAPFFKTGGLGDVAGALPKELAKKNLHMNVALPYFSQIPQSYKEQCEEVTDFYVKVGEQSQPCSIKRLNLAKVTYYFIDNSAYFGRENLYGYDDDGERFAFFSQAIIEMLAKIDLSPELIHVNDYHTAMIPFLLKEKYTQPELSSIKTLLTIHNIEFQGVFDRKTITEYFGLELAEDAPAAAETNENLNYLKQGILYADWVNTVSLTYAEEIQTSEFGFGLDQILHEQRAKLSGILNGIDYELNDPAADAFLAANFSAADLAGKKIDKETLQKQLNLPVRAEVLLIGIVSRLTAQKGFALVLEGLEQLLKEDLQLVLLGTGDPKLEASYQEYAQRYPQKFAAKLTFDLAAAQQIYAGADLFLMPSIAEPCGLSQMIAMRYGTLPVVHEVGGLKDTVVPFDKAEATGFVFADFDVESLLASVNAAVTLFKNDQSTWVTMVQTAMNKDFSWEKSSQKYLELYQDVTETAGEEAV
ncbi:glycogen synthase GlgA [Erwinia sp. CPCC 100877]|nr:glycogen synthase GlgA [Erwinia sp. CPCC 100877]